MQEIELVAHFLRQLLTGGDQPGIEITSGDRAKEERETGNEIQRNRNRNFEPKGWLPDYETTHGKPPRSELAVSSSNHDIAFAGFGRAQRSG
jgi:hypothetical protein